jgi:PAS domain S-box-containing protein
MKYESSKLGADALQGMGEEMLTRSPISIVITDPTLDDNPIVYVNPAFERMTGYRREVVMGRNCRFLQQRDTQQEGVGQIRAAVAEGRSEDVMLKNYTAMGEPFINHLHIAPVTDSNGDLVAFLGMQVRRDALEAEREQEDRNTIDHLELLLRETNLRMRSHLKLLADLIRGSETGQTLGGVQLMSHRVEALSLLYEDLAPDAIGTDQSTVSAGEYISKVAATLSTLDPRQSVRFNLRTDPCLMGVDRAAMLGLLVSEIVTVLLGQVKGQRNHKLIDIRLEETGSVGATLVIETDFPNGADNPMALPPTSFKIVKALAEQLNANLSMVKETERAVLTLKFGVLH